MSLTSHLLAKGAVSAWMREQFPITERLTVVSSCHPALREATTLLPSRIKKADGKYPYAIMGTALDYRLRLYFSPFPPTIVAHHGARIVTRGRYQHPDIILSRDGSHVRPESQQNTGIPIEVVAEFFADLEKATTRLAPTGRLLTKAKESELARYCVVLANWDAVFRAGPFINSPLLGNDAPQSVAELLELCTPAMARDMSQLSRLFFERCPDLVALGKNVVQNPTFAGSLLIGGADADFIAAGCLWDIKSSIHSTFQGAWIYQLLGYVLLDFDDAYAIREVGIYMARQGLCLKWTLAELLETISVGVAKTLPLETRLQQLRAEFRALLEKDELDKQSQRLERMKEIEAEQKVRREIIEAEIARALEEKKATNKEKRKRKKQVDSPHEKLPN